LGHYKLLLRLVVSDVRDATINLSERLLYLYYQISIATANIGASLQRWQQITTCVIEKIKGVARIDKLRVNHIFEADYNLLLKIVWSQRAVWNMHKKERVHDGQAGSRPGRRAIDMIVQQE
jgi:hypothetical protein